MSIFECLGPVASVIMTAAVQTGGIMVLFMLCIRATTCYLSGLIGKLLSCGLALVSSIFCVKVFNHHFSLPDYNHEFVVAIYAVLVAVHLVIVNAIFENPKKEQGNQTRGENQHHAANQ